MDKKSDLPTLAIVVPCYNESAALKHSIKALEKKLEMLIDKDSISGNSYVLFVDDGSVDSTWEIISDASKIHSKGQSGKIFKRIRGLRLSCNVGHQNALLGGLHSVAKKCDISISIDADLQDDIDAIDLMVEEFKKGAQIVLGVRDDRSSDTIFKRVSAIAYYKLLNLMNVHAAYNHADFRLMSSGVLKNLMYFSEKNLFLRAMPKLLHREISIVKYARGERVAGESKYPLRKMLGLAWDGITSFSILPLRFVTFLGVFISITSFFMALAVLWSYLNGNTISGWASITLPMYILGGLLMLSVGILGEYLAKIFLEVKARPQFLVDEVVNMENDND